MIKTSCISFISHVYISGLLRCDWFHELRAYGCTFPSCESFRERSQLSRVLHYGYLPLRVWYFLAFTISSRGLLVHSIVVLQRVVVPTLRWLLNAQLQTSPSYAAGSNGMFSDLLTNLLIGICYVSDFW